MDARFRPSPAADHQAMHPTPAQAAVGYLLVGIAWILATDLLISSAFHGGLLPIGIGMLKGVGFILLTSAVFYGLLERQRRVVADTLRSVPRRDGGAPVPGAGARNVIQPGTDWLAELVDATPECVGIASLEGRALYLNPAGCRLLGVDNAELEAGMHISEFYTEAAWENMRQEVWPMIRRHGIWEGETELVGERGETIPVHKVLIAHRDATGMITHLSTHARDLRQLRKQQTALRQTAGILANTAEGVMMVGRSERIEWVNAAFTRILGYEQDEVIGCSPGEFGEAGFDHEFFRKLCADVTENGHWQGELAFRRQNGEVFPVRMSIGGLHGGDGRLLNFSCIFSDLTRYKHFESQLSFLANHDPLTGLPNAARFQEQLGDVLAGLGDGRQVCVLVLDLYDFSMLNESFGRDVGDRVLKEMAGRLESLASEGYRVARLGGDEFGLLAESEGARMSPVLEAERVRGLFRQPFEVDGTELYLAGNVGVVLAPEDGLDVQTLIRNAEIGVRRAKLRGQNAYEFYSDQLRARSTETILLASGLRRAIHDDAFELRYQPIMDLAGGTVWGVEALVRWNHPDLGPVPPDRFIDVAERTGLIQALGEVVMDHACRDFRSLLETCPDLRLSVNVSPIEIEPDHFPSRLLRATGEAGIDPSRVELEITESLMIQDPEQTRIVFRDLSEHGFRISIDDFGTGFSSLAMLKQFPAHSLKIDKSFIQGLPASQDDVMMTRTIIAMADGLGLTTIAEGIETNDHLQFLVGNGCRLGQGYYFARPMPLDELRTFVAG